MEDARTPQDAGRRRLCYLATAIAVILFNLLFLHLIPFFFGPNWPYPYPRFAALR